MIFIFPELYVPQPAYMFPNLLTLSIYWPTPATSINEVLVRVMTLYVSKQLNLISLTGKYQYLEMNIFKFCR